MVSEPRGATVGLCSMGVHSSAAPPRWQAIGGSPPWDRSRKSLATKLQPWVNGFSQLGELWQLNSPGCLAATLASAANAPTGKHCCAARCPRTAQGAADSIDQRIASKWFRQERTIRRKLIANHLPRRSRHIQHVDAGPELFKTPAPNLSLLNVADRVLLAGNAFEKQAGAASPRMMQQQLSRPEEDQAARSAWLARMNGRFDLVYLASNARWYSTPKDLEGWLAARAKAM